MISKKYLLLVVIVCVSFYLNQAYGQVITCLLPGASEHPDWTITDSAKVYAGDDLFMLIDGGADLYLEYGFRQAVACHYENRDHSSLQVEIYQMTSDSSAYGIFSTMQSLKGKKIPYGHDARLFDYYMVFWKDNYFITITGSDQKEQTKAGMFALATAIDSGILQNGNIPGWMDVLPKDSLIEKKYFRGNIGLSNIYSFGPGNTFQFKEGVYGNYGALKVIILPYSSEVAAKDQLLKATASLSSGPLFKIYKYTAHACVFTDGSNNQVFLDVKDANVRIFIYSDIVLFQRFMLKL